MIIMYFSQFYTPESIAPSFRATDNSRLWAEAGNNVTVFTGYPNYPVGKIFDGYEPKLLKEENLKGVRILRSKLIAVPNTSTFKRLENALSFFFFGIINVLFNQKKIGKKYDVVLGTSGVIFTALLGWIFAAIHRIPFVFEIRDITYVQLQATGRCANSLVVRGMKALELFLCKRAKMVVVVTNGFKKTLVTDGIPIEKIEVITNGVDVDKIEMTTSQGKLVLSYFGTLGLSQNISDSFRYAEVISQYCDNFEYLMIGEGAQKDGLKKEVEQSRFSFVKMLSGMPASELEPYYGTTQWSVITLKKSENFKYTIPSKLFQVMGRGIAVLFIGPDGETADIIRDYKAGLVLTGTIEEDKAELEKFLSNPNWQDELSVMGQRGRAAVLENYSRKNLAMKYINLMNGVTRNGKIAEMQADIQYGSIHDT